MPIQLTENSPSEGHYYASGRGGAGNYRRRSSIFTPASPISIIPSTTSSTSTPRVYFGGRGGAGNIKPTYERAIFSFDEELERDRLFHEHQAPVYSIGRGGAGNIIASENTPPRYYPGAIPCSSPSSQSTSSSMASPRSSMSSAEGRSLMSSSGLRNSADRVWERLSRARSSSSSPSSPRTSS